jgi:hypothetical protein
MLEQMNNRRGSKKGENRGGGHYKRDKDRLYLEEQADNKQQALNKALRDELNSKRFLKAVALAARIIKEKDRKSLNESDYKQIAKTIYKDSSKFKAIRLKRMMSTEIAKNMLNQELIRVYSEIDFDEKKYKELMKMSIDTTLEKKDVKNALKLAEKYEKAHQLTANTSQQSQIQQNNQFNFHEYREQNEQEKPDSLTDASDKVQKEPENEEKNED